MQIGWCSTTYNPKVCGNSERITAALSITMIKYRSVYVRKHTCVTFAFCRIILEMLGHMMEAGNKSSETNKQTGKLFFCRVVVNKSVFNKSVFNMFVRYGEYWGTGDVIGCAVDIDNRTIQYWKNGKDMTVAFNDVNVNGLRLCPFVGLSRRTKVLFNFGKEPFVFPQEGYNMLHSFLSEKEMEQLLKLFLRYRGIYMLLLHITYMQVIVSKK